MTDDPSKKISNPVDAEYASKTWDILASIGIITTTMVPVPPSMIKSLRKSIDRLITGATDLGMTYIEGAAARRKSQIEGKQIVASHVAGVVAERVTQDNSLMERAIETFAADLMVKQTNKEKVLALAVDELSAAKTFDDSGKIIDDDWLGEFATLASNKSNVDVQQLLGKILAGEIRNPGTFSPLTLHVLSTLTPEIAKQFEIYCNLCIELEPEKRGNNIVFIAHGPYPEFLNKGLPEYNINFGGFMVLQSYGLLAQKLDVAYGIAEPILEVTMEIGEAKLRLKSKTGEPVRVYIPSIAPLSIPGCELRRIIALKVPPVHLQKQIEYLNGMGFDVFRE